MKIGKVIKQIRKSKHLTQEELSSKCGFSKSYISMIESEQKKPSLDVLEKICNGLEVPFPMLTILLLNEEDIPIEKRELFKKVLPTLQALIEETFA